jgi:hypothetical protein
MVTFRCSSCGRQITTSASHQRIACPACAAVQDCRSDRSPGRLIGAVARRVLESRSPGAVKEGQCKC